MQTSKNGVGHATCLRQRENMTCKALRSRVESFSLCVMSGRKQSSQPKVAIASERPDIMGHGVTNRDFHSACERVAAFVRAGCLSSRTQSCPRGGAASRPLIAQKSDSKLFRVSKEFRWFGRVVSIADADGTGRDKMALKRLTIAGLMHAAACKASSNRPSKACISMSRGSAPTSPMFLSNACCSTFARILLSSCDRVSTASGQAAELRVDRLCSVSARCKLFRSIEALLSFGIQLLSASCVFFFCSHSWKDGRPPAPADSCIFEFS